MKIQNTSGPVSLLNVGEITSLNSKRATIVFPDFSVRVFTRYQGQYCSEIRVWKLPPHSGFWSMFNTQNLVWAMYGDAAKAIHGFFTPPPVTHAQDKRSWLQVLCDGVSQCQNYEEVAQFLSNIEGMLHNDTEAICKLSTALNKSSDEGR